MSFAIDFIGRELLKGVLYMENNYRGDTFWRSYNLNYENSPYVFQKGDILKVAFFDIEGKEFLSKEIIVEEQNQKIDVLWNQNEMATLPNGKYVLEVEITTANFRKTYQEIVDISKDYIVS